MSQFHAVVPLGDTLASAVRMAIGDQGAHRWSANGVSLKFFDLDGGEADLPCTAYAPLIATLAEEWALETTAGHCNAVTVIAGLSTQESMIRFEPTTIYTEAA